MLKNLPAVQKTKVLSPGGEDPLEKGIDIHFSILPGEFHGQRSLEGFGPWGPKSRIWLSDWHFHFGAFLMVQIVKHLPAMQETWVYFFIYMTYIGAYYFLSVCGLPLYFTNGIFCWVVFNVVKSSLSHFSFIVIILWVFCKRSLFIPLGHKDILLNYLLWTL